MGTAGQLAYFNATGNAVAATSSIFLSTSGNFGIGTTTPGSTLTVSGSACFSQGQGVGSVLCGTTPGNIYYKTANTGNYDIAENYLTQDAYVGAGNIVSVASPLVQNGSIVASTTIDLATSTESILGVISTNPGVLLGGADPALASTTAGVFVQPVALSGRVPVVIDFENGNIHAGDRIALSSMAGVGRKANEFEPSIGIALENSTQVGGEATSSVMVFLSVQGGISLMDLGQALGDATSTVDVLAATSTIQDFSTTLQSDISSLGQMVVHVFNGAISASVGIFDKVFAKEVDTDKLVASSATTGQLCAQKSDGTSVCVTGDQLAALLSGTPPPSQGTGGDSSSSATSTPDDSSATSTPSAPTITLIGADPAQLNVGDSYIDPGVTVQSTVSPNIGYTMALDGGATTTPDQFHLDTSTPGTHIILFSATDQNGQTGTATRTVIISDPTATTTDATSTQQ